MMRYFILLLILCFSGTCFAVQERRDGAVLYKIRADATQEQKDNLDRVLTKHKSKFPKKKAKIGGWEMGVATDKQNKTEEEIAQEVNMTGAVEFAEPDYLVAPTFTPNDDYYYLQWQWQRIGAEDAWRYTRGSSNIIVSHGDTGFAKTHRDLNASHFLDGFNVADDPVTNNTTQVFNHGVATMGMTMAAINNDSGVAGLAPESTFLPIRISNFADGSAFISDGAESIDVAVTNGSKAHSISYDFVNSAAVNASATAAKAAGMLTVITMGNGGVNKTTYASSPAFLTVNGITSSDARNGDWGMCLDLTAPNWGVYGLSTTTWTTLYGTSFAAPQVVGLAALIWSINSSFTVDQVEAFIVNNTDDLGVAGWDAQFGWGCINASRSVRAAYTFEHGTDVNRTVMSGRGTISGRGTMQ